MKYTREDPTSGAKTSDVYQLKVKITHAGGKTLTLFSSFVTVLHNANNVVGSTILNLPSGLSQDLDFMTLESTISNMSFECVNGTLSNNQTLAQYIYSKFYDKENNLKNSKVEIFLQYNAFSNYLLYTGYLESVKPVDIYETVYRFNVEDVTRQIKKECLGQYFDIKYGVTENLPVGSYGTFTKFARKESPGNVAASGIYNYIETNAQATLDTWIANNDDWWYVIRWSGHPVDFAKELIDITAGTGKFDTSSFYVVKTNSKNQVIISFDYEFTEGIEDTLEFIRTQCLMPCYAFFYIGENGKIYLKQIEQPVVTLPMITFDESNIIEIESSDIGTENIVNFASVKYDFNEEDTEYISSLYNLDDSDRESIEMFGTLPENYVIELMGMNRNAIITDDKQVFADNLTAYIFNRNSVSVKTLVFKAIFEYAKEIKIGDFIKFYHTKIVDWKKESANLGNRGLDYKVDSAYAVIDETYWGDYTNVYVVNECFIDAQYLSGIDHYNGTLTWNYNWYIEEIQNKAIPVPIKNVLTLPIQEEMRVNKMIAIETFEDILTNYKINDNFLAFHNAD